METFPKRAAAYCRVSTRTEMQDGSLLWQQEYYRELFSKSADLELADIYADQGSGRSIRRRPRFRQLLRDCEAGKIDVVYTKSISRFSRNIADCVSAVGVLSDLGIPVFFQKEGLDSLGGNPLFFHILAILAQEESESIGGNMRWSIQKRHQAGIPTGRVPYGYRRIDSLGHWRIEETEANRVRFAFTQAARGTCYQEVRLGLDQMEAQEGSLDSWTQNRDRLPRLLRNLSYTGDYITDGYYTALGKGGLRYSKKNRGERDRYYLTAHHPGLVSKELFQRVQALMDLGLLRSNRRKLTDKETAILQDLRWQ